MSLDQDALIRAYLRDSLSIIKHSLSWSQQGSGPAYRVIAAQLRLLLCDTTRVHGQIVDVSLASRLVPDLCFFPLEAGQGGQARIDRGRPPLPRREWLDQAVAWPSAGGEPWTLREMIRWVCDRDGGVHVDLQPRAAPRPDLERWIVVLGEYMLAELSRLVESQ